MLGEDRKDNHSSVPLRVCVAELPSENSHFSSWFRRGVSVPSTSVSVPFLFPHAFLSAEPRGCHCRKCVWVLWNSGKGEKPSSALTCWFDLCVTCCLLQQSPTTVAAATAVFMETVAVGWATGARIAPRGDGGRFVQVDFYCRRI